MDRCHVCGAEEFIPYVCRYCGGVHCVYHRLPENHECPNIEQARAPRPYVRAAERKGTVLTLRQLSVSKLGKFSSISNRELTALIIAWGVLGISFSVQWLFVAPNPLEFLAVFSLTLIVVGVGFLGHELAHKFTAEKYGCLAEFKLWTYGAIMALLFALLSRGSFVFAAPGAVYIASRTGYFGEGLDRKSNGIVSLMGPVVNIIAAAIFFVAGVAASLLNVHDLTFNFGYSFLQSGFVLNLWLAAFNMLPIFILDGQKVFAWDRRIWVLVALPLWTAAVFALLGLL